MEPAGLSTSVFCTGEYMYTPKWTDVEIHYVLNSSQIFLFKKVQLRRKAGRSNAVSVDGHNKSNGVKKLPS